MNKAGKKKFRLKPNQIDHLVQWLALIMFMELVIIFLPIAFWMTLILVGIAFLTGFLLRAIKKYPGEHEPLWVDISTSGLSFSIALMLLFLKNSRICLPIAVISPEFILIPHFSYIISNKEITPPGFRKFMKRKIPRK